MSTDDLQAEIRRLFSDANSSNDNITLGMAKLASFVADGGKFRTSLISGSTYLQWGAEQRYEWRKVGLPVLTRYESERYLPLLCTLLNKREWWRKLLEKDIVSRWKTEFLQHLPLQCFEYLIKEMEFVAEKELIRFPVPHYPRRIDAYSEYDSAEIIVSPTTTHGVFYSDSIIPRDLKRALASFALRLEKKALENSAWHNGSNNQVLDLLHPSQHCLVYGRSYLSLTPNAAFGQFVIENKNKNESYHPLATDVWIDNEHSVRIESYINNLDPKIHPDLYHVFSAILKRTMPMLELALASLKKKARTRTTVKDVVSLYHDYCIWKYRQLHPEVKLQCLVDEEQYDEILMQKYFRIHPTLVLKPVLEEEQLEEIVHFHSEDFWDEIVHSHYKRKKPISLFNFAEQYDDVGDYFHRNRMLKLIKPPPPPRHSSASESLRNKRLQVYVKLANIHLTPENNSYPGGSWHLEGLPEDAIIATGIYYYSMENISESKVQFRHFMSNVYEIHQNSTQNVAHHFNILYGIKHLEPVLQSSGFVTAEEGRFVCFPNFQQHCVTPFHLEDPTRPGHRKILVFFFVSPDVYVPSSRWIPPQDLSNESIFSDLSKKYSLCFDIVQHIKSFMGSQMSTDENQKFSLKYAETRKPKVGVDESEWGHEALVNFCEH